MREIDLLAAYGMTYPVESTAKHQPTRIKCRIPGCITMIDQLMTNRNTCRYHLRQGSGEEPHE